MPRAQLLVASNCTCYQHLEDNLHRSSADSCDVGFSRWECWEPFLISVTNVGIGLRWFSAGPLYGAVLMAQSAALNFILVRDAQCARHHIARSDQNDTECVPCAKNRSRSCQSRKVYTCERFPTSSRQATIQPLAGQKQLQNPSRFDRASAVGLVLFFGQAWTTHHSDGNVTCKLCNVKIGISRSHSSSCQPWALCCWALAATVDVACVTSHGMYTRCIQACHVLYYPRMVPPKGKGDLELRRKKNSFIFFILWKETLGPSRC